MDVGLSAPNELARTVEGARKTIKLARRNMEPGQRRILELVLCEIDVIAPLVAVSTSLANALEKGQGSGLDELLTAYLPQEPATFLALLPECMRLEPNLDAIKAVQVFASRLAVAKQVSLGLKLGDAATSTVPGFHAGKLAIIWRRTAEACLDAIEAIELRLDDDSNVYPDRIHVVKHLRQSRRGGTPSLKEEGGLNIPGWVDHPRTARVSFDEPCVVLHEGREHDVYLNDLSRGGAGFSGLIEAPRGATVSLRLSNGRVLSGTIAWMREDRWGLKLDMPLDRMDPLLSGS